MKTAPSSALFQRFVLSFAALILLIGICISCSAPSIDTSAPPALTTTDSRSSSSNAALTAPPISQATTAPSTTAPITTVPITTVPITTAPTTTAPITTAPSVTVVPVLEAFQAAIADTPRDAAYISVCDLTENRLLYTSGESQMIYPASTTKLFTLLYALTIAEPNDVFTVGDEIKIAPADSSKAWISIDQKFTLRDLAAAMLLPSGNDAAYTVAVGCGRKLAEDARLSAQEALGRFMDGMNAYAAELGLASSHFVTPDGYHDPDHYTSMQDMAVIARMAYENELMAELMAMPSYTAVPLNFGKDMTWNNTNLLLSENSSYYDPSVIGMKTGYHSDAGYCLIAAAEREGRAYMVLLFKGEDRSVRFADAKEILSLCFSMLEE